MSLELSFTARNVLLGASLLGVVGGVTGCFALLRRQSLLGDALAHAALPGVCVGYLLTRSKSPLPLFAGALAAGVIGALVILAVVRWSRIKEDGAIGMVLSVFFGIGIVLLTYIQKLPFGNQSGLDKFLFGQAATLLPRDLQLMALLGGLVLLVVVLFYKELKLLCFDPDFAASVGFPTRRLEVLVTLLLVTVVVVGLQTVGVVLIVATLITPAAAARQWTERLSIMLLLAGAVGGAAGAVGALVSATVPRLPTGPVIVLCASVLLVVSLLVAPRRGLLWALLEERRAARRIRQENLLKDLYGWQERRHGDWFDLIPWPMLMGVRGQSQTQLARLAAPLERRGLLARIDGGVALTQKGFAAARRVVRKHRLWELYLARRLELPSDHVHRDAEVMEHALSDEAVGLIERTLGYPELDPHGRPIPREDAA
ncbi:MAG TPA: iron chelate uptake ABC transporter family permease subunit [Thermoanaerobaculia bacterium]|nr:iron chelate uptake ABC transporter family permease subunit [Thermoanaerobaculia bacterium]